MACVSDETLLAALRGHVEGHRQLELERHVDSCARCTTVLTTLGGLAMREPDRIAGHDARDETLASGTRVGRFVIERLLGAGGMGMVYIATDEQLGRKVAIKLLQPHRTHGAARLRLLREARSLARVSHPNVVVLHDVGAFGDQVFVAMELVDGVTLAEWLPQAARSWREVVALFLQVGRGLAAAHAVGIVHRDVKPHNLLVARDGRVRVVDFGLAVDLGEASSDAPEVPIADSTERLTQSGALVGTPAYMAPEQQRREPATALSDQFSYCVSFYEALCGDRPAPDGRRTWRSSTGHVGSPPPAIRRIVARGLELAPAARYPTMEALLRDLERAISPVRRARWAVPAVLALALAAGGAWLGLRSDDDACAADGRLLLGIWDPARRASAHVALVATGAPYAESEWHTVERSLDRYAAAWGQRRAAVCRARPANDDARVACLDQRRENLRSVVNVLATANAATLAHAADAAAGLDDLAMCDGPASTTEPVPHEPALRQQVQIVRGQLATRRARDDLGDYAGGLVAHDELLTRAGVVPYPPLRVEALIDKATFQRRIDDRAGSAATLVAASEAGEALRYDRETATAWIELVYAYDGLHRPADAQRAMRYAAALLHPLGPEADRLRVRLDRFAAYVYGRAEQFEQALARARAALTATESQVDHDAPQLADAYNTLTWVLGTMGRIDEADVYCRKALDVAMQICGPDCPLVARALYNLGASANGRGDFTTGLGYYSRVLAIYEKTIGANSLLVGTALFNRAESLEGLRRIDDAIAGFRRARELYIAALGPDDGAVAIAAEKIGVLERAQGRPAAAVKPLEQAIAIRETVAVPGPPSELARVRFLLARSLADIGGDRSRARSLATAARTAYAATGNDAAALVEIDSWLTRH